MPSQGSIEVCGVTWTDRLNREGRRKLARNLQLVFQDPYTSLSPRMRTGSLIGEGLRVHHLSTSRADERDRVARLMTSVGLGSELARSYPRELSGAASASASPSPGCSRSTRSRPALDELVPSLDVSIQAEILDLLRQILTAQRDLSTVIISHDLAVIRFSCHRVIVMCDGAIVEEGDVEDIFLAAPERPYTKKNRSHPCRARRVRASAARPRRPSAAARTRKEPPACG